MPNEASTMKRSPIELYIESDKVNVNELGPCFGD
jgi:hypothetical protein